jgi:hypothetical protein
MFLPKGTYQSWQREIGLVCARPYGGARLAGRARAARAARRLTPWDAQVKTAASGVRGACSYPRLPSQSASLGRGLEWGRTAVWSHSSHDVLIEVLKSEPHSLWDASWQAIDGSTCHHHPRDQGGVAP